MREFEVPEVDYTRYTNRQLAAVPLAVLLVAILVIGGTWAVTGQPVDRGIDFTGGTEIQVQTSEDIDQLRSTFPDASRIQPIQSQANTFLITFQSTDASSITDRAESAGYEVTGVQTKSASFGASAQGQALVGVGFAFVGMSIIVFILFRTFVPSIAVVVSAFSDIVIPVALMNVFGIKLSLGTVAALLMLIGYSVDSDLLLNNHILRRHGGFYESAHRAMRTGVTMTLTSLVAMIVMTIVSSPLVLGIPLLPDIGIILVFGLTADLMNTYMLNMSLLRWYKYEGVAR